MSFVPLKSRNKGVLVHQVQDSDLATNWRNDVPVLATPVLLWLGELAAMRAIEGTLQAGQMTLGYGHDMRHLAPTPKGWNVTLEAELIRIEDKILTFSIEARDGEGVIASGTHTRAIVDKGRFLARFEAKRDRHDPFA
ncbi:MULTISPECIES: thioesterase family protein [Pannonibacter]|jgi:fluoroacetyl-CoA thioesterase|uniref:thioesterase family protein n=1 Tax=Pannonibacter TaxID=227873 RepID=UPI000D0F05B5|nr:MULTISPECIES: hotdog domain-containing protein [Pannonibacter]MCY1706292.1 thioesterase [Pannonibacter sp. SL95]